MTLGMTGVVWISRPAVVNSARLALGAGPAPLAAASTAWASISGVLDSVAIGVTHVMAELSAGWQGDAADAAQSKLSPFLAWTHASSVTAATASAKAMAQSTAYTTALAIMPSAAEIAVVTAAKATAYSTGGAVNGTAAAAEAADTAMNVRAALVMEGYEAATTVLGIPLRFSMPPPIAHALPGTVDLVQNAAGYVDSEASNFTGSDSQSTVAASAQSVGAQTGNAALNNSALNNPAFNNPGAALDAANHVGSSAGSSAGTAASKIGSALHHGSHAGSIGQGSAGLGSAGQGSAGTIAKTSAAGLLGISSLFGRGANSQGAALTAGAIDSPAAKTADAATREVRGAEANKTAGGIPGGQARPDEDDEHETPDYLKQFEHFEDGRTVAPSVIGADPDWAEQ